MDCLRHYPPSSNTPTRLRDLVRFPRTCFTSCRDSFTLFAWKRTRWWCINRGKYGHFLPRRFRRSAENKVSEAPLHQNLPLTALTMKQKMVIRAQMTDMKGRSKAMKIAAGVPGVISVGIEGKDKDQIVVIGEEVDVVGLTRLVRKKMGFAELVSVSVMEEKKAEKKEEKKVASTTEIVALPAPWTNPANWSHPASMLSVSDYPVAKYDDPCSIM